MNSIYFNNLSSSYDSSEEEYFNNIVNQNTKRRTDQPINLNPVEKVSTSSCMPSSDAIWVQMPIRNYRSTEPKQIIPEYPSSDPSLVKQGDYK